jgi:hypothetical protein
MIGMRNRWGGKWEWGGKEKGDRGQFTSNLGTEWTGIAPHAKEGFQVSKRDSGTRGGFFRQTGDYQGDSPRGYHGDCAMCSHIMSTLYISCYCVCRANKRLCLGYK